MTDSHKKIYIAIRAEQIKDFHDKNNGHLLNKNEESPLSTGAYYPEGLITQLLQRN